MCMICFRPMCDIRCKGRFVSPSSPSGPCSRVFHKACIKSKGRRVRNWKCPLCSKKEIEVSELPFSHPQKFSKTLNRLQRTHSPRHRGSSQEERGADLQSARVLFLSCRMSSAASATRSSAVSSCAASTAERSIIAAAFQSTASLSPLISSCPSSVMPYT